MNTQRIKSYAPKARTDFIAVLSKQAAKYGITSEKIQPVEVKGDVALIDGRPFPVTIIKPRAALVQLIQQQGFTIVIEHIAYSWFNRLCAIRYMELHDYLGHGRRVLSHPDQAGGLQLLDECLDIDLPGLNKSRVHQLKLDGNQDEQLYRELLLAQCHALHQAMPFLFEPLDDETELLLPDNLTKTDSLIKALVTAIPEDDWQNIEIIGWLYQFYISEKKDEVIGKVVKSEDIPAATQLFTPNWIVKYMVQNSLGAQWLATYPDSPLKAQMDYYIEPAEQTDEVNAQLAAITPSQLNPEELTLIDPASGSGHILVEAYDLFKAIYLERGYRQRDVPQLILEKNLFGLDIDQRAAQLTGFALMMKGREDDRRLFERGITLNVMALQNSTGFDAEGLTNGLKLADYGQQLSELTELKDLFEHATTFGSLIKVPEGLAEKLPVLKQLSKTTSQDMFVSEALKRLGPLVQQGEMLAAQYDAVVANPPYMGARNMDEPLKSMIAAVFPDSKLDAYAAFIERSLELSQHQGHVAMVTMHSWMFLKSYKALRERLLSKKILNNLIHLGPQAFSTISGAVVNVAAFSFQNTRLVSFQPTFLRLVDGNAKQKRQLLLEQRNRFDGPKQSVFSVISGTPVAYWISDRVRQCFVDFPDLGGFASPKVGMNTTKNELFLRRWSEVDIRRIGFGFTTRNEARRSGRRWFPYNKGGPFRKWYGNNEFVVNYEDDGRLVCEYIDSSGARVGSSGRVINRDRYFQPGVTWGDIAASTFSARSSPAGFVFDVKGSSGFPDAQYRSPVLALLCSKVASLFMAVLNPTTTFQVGDLARIPAAFNDVETGDLPNATSIAVDLAKADWDSLEASWDFNGCPLLLNGKELSLQASYERWVDECHDRSAKVNDCEHRINDYWIDAYGLRDELTPDVPIEQITLTVNPAYRYGAKLTEDELWIRFREDSMEELVSYAIGCMMGRYSLDEPGLIYAHSGNEGFDSSKYSRFSADDDGIIPLTDTEWFEDDACNRLIEFMALAWDAASLEDNLAFLADNLSPKKSESSRDTLRRYLSDKFFKDHLKTYKKRPIYWLFSSGKQKSFQCLVYLHRYNEGTLARMRTEYVIPLTAKLATHVQKLEQDKDASSSTAEIKKLEKQIARLHKQQAELSHFDEKLRHHADQRITLDLDDGVKVNYGKFGDLLAEVKAVHGKTPEIRN